MKTLKEIIQENHLSIFDKINLEVSPHYGTDKGEPKSYIDGYYEENFKKFKDRNITLVEIGVRSGASLKLWSEYFNENSKIYGLDNLNDKNQNSVPVNESWVNSNNVQYIIGDAYSKEISDKLDNIDILIDDGPHSIESHIKLLELYIPKMNEGGIIIIEDVSYSKHTIEPYIPQYLKKNFHLHDFGIFYDNKLIVITGF
jgi:predicted O-methyltransferase YrrM